MGFIRGAVVTLFSIVLFLSLFAMNFTAILSSSLQYNALQPALKTSADKILSNSMAEGSIFSEEEKSYMDHYCLIEDEYAFAYENYSFPIPCEVIEQGEDAIISYITENFIDVIYYQEYNCDFWDCVRESPIPFVLVSKKAHDYWNNNFLILFCLSVLIFALTFFISSDRPVRFIIGGVLIILSALPFRNLNWVLKLIPDNLDSVFSVFFTRAHAIFIIMLVIGKQIRKH